MDPRLVELAAHGARLLGGVVVGAVTGRGARRKGYQFAQSVAQFFEQRGLEVMRRAAGEAGDDIRLLDFPAVSIECKNQAAQKLGAWMTQARVQAPGRIPVLIHKRHGVTDPARQWVTLELGDLPALLGLDEKAQRPKLRVLLDD